MSTPREAQQTSLTFIQTSADVWDQLQVWQELIVYEPKGTSSDLDELQSRSEHDQPNTAKTVITDGSIRGVRGTQRLV